jgi:hypothetical protein
LSVDKTKQNKKNKKSTAPAAAAAAFTEEHPSPSAFSLYYFSISMHRGKSSSPPYPHTPT